MRTCYVPTCNDYNDHQLVSDVVKVVHDLITPAAPPPPRSVALWRFGGGGGGVADAAIFYTYV